MDNPFNSPAILSLCPGIGGLERGLERAIGKINIVAYVEIEAFIIANLVAGMESGILDPAPVFTDVKTFPSSPFYNKIHGIIGGYPCQPFSNAGKRKGNKDPRHLWPHIARHIKAINPVWCFFENVPGHISMGYPEVYASLHNLGYQVENGIYSAQEIGAPHRRERFFILAIRNDWKLGNSTIGQNKFRKYGNLEFKEGEGRCINNAIGNASIELDYSNQHRYEPEYEIPTGRHSPELTGEKLAIASCAGIQRCMPSWHRCAQLANGYRIQKLAHSIGSGFAMQWFNRKPEQTGNHRTINPGAQWPAKPGEPQHPWEEPRTIKPGMGISIDGYNFREDLLRAIGNSVVEQTAEIAFVDLMNKHFKNNKQ